MSTPRWDTSEGTIAPPRIKKGYQQPPIWVPFWLTKKPALRYAAKHFFLTQYSAGEDNLTLRGLREGVLSLQKDLHVLGPKLARVVPDFSNRYAPVLQTYREPFRVRPLVNCGAFKASRRQITFNATSFRIFQRPINAAEAAGTLTPDLAAIVRHIALEQLVLHELSHITVGLIRFGDVQALKGMIGVHALGELDLVADASAARIGARLEMLRAQEKGDANYASRLLQQLFVMGNYAFPAFGAPTDKPHKRQRFLGLAMMAARVHEFMRRDTPCKLERGELTVDTPLYPYFEPDGKMLVSAFAPDRILWGGGAVRVDPQLLSLTCEELDKVPFQVSVSRAAELLRAIAKFSGYPAYHAPERPLLAAG